MNTSYSHLKCSIPILFPYRFIVSSCCLQFIVYFCRHLGALSVGAVGRCLRTSIRSPVAPIFWETVEALYILPAESDQINHSSVRRLRDSLWPLLIDCRVRYKMFGAALQLLDTYSKVWDIYWLRVLLLPECHISSIFLSLSREV